MVRDARAEFYRNKGMGMSDMSGDPETRKKQSHLRHIQESTRIKHYNQRDGRNSFRNFSYMVWTFALGALCLISYKMYALMNMDSKGKKGMQSPGIQSAE